MRNTAAVGIHPIQPLYSRPLRPHAARAFFVSLAAYVVLFLVHLRPAQGPAWYLLALWVVPALIGVSIGKAMPPKDGVRAAAGIAGRAMFVYAAISLISTHARIGSGSSSAGQVFLVGLFVSVVYAVFAGGVAAGTNALWSGARTPRKTTVP